MKTSRNTVSVLLRGAVLALAACCLVARAEEKWTPLFNGKDLTGWVQRGGKAKYSVENGEIVGTAVANTPNSFLCTEKNYGDFVLELEFKCDSDLNSGVQVRSECFDTSKVVTQPGKKDIKIAAKRVHGYQVEIDVSEKNARWWVAGLYDEGRRSWLFPGQLGGDKKAFTQQGAQAYKRGEWNTLRVEASGDSIKTFLNGTPRASVKDGMTLSGFIGLQVHNVGKAWAGKQVRFRNIRIQELSAPPSADK